MRMQITTKSSLQDLAVALDPNYQVEPDVEGALRLISALSTKSTKAADFINSMPGVAVEVLSELGFVNAAKDANAAPASLQDFAPDHVEEEFDADGADDGVGEEIAEALDEIVEATKSISASVNELEQRVSAVEARKGISFGQGWDNYEPVQKSTGGGDLWAGSAFDIQA